TDNRGSIIRSRKPVELRVHQSLRLVLDDSDVKRELCELRNVKRRMRGRKADSHSFHAEGLLRPFQECTVSICRSGAKFEIREAATPPPVADLRCQRPAGHAEYDGAWLTRRTGCRQPRYFTADRSELIDEGRGAHNACD